jgi:predicted lipoprotein with Yx(FWY)xxD motif
MRPAIPALLASALLSLSSAYALAANDRPKQLEHPGVVALSQQTDSSWVYKSFPNSLPLYVFEGDEPGKSNCDDRACTAVWPIVKADENDEPVGNWTVVLRDDGERQWAYKGYPVYKFFIDTANNPQGIGMREGWYYDVTTMYKFFIDMVNNPQGIGLPEGRYYEEAKDELGQALPDDDDRPIWSLLEP